MKKHLIDHVQSKQPNESDLCVCPSAANQAPWQMIISCRICLSLALCLDYNILVTTRLLAVCLNTGGAVFLS